MKVDLLLVNPGNRLEQFANLNTLATVAQPLGIAILASFVRQQGYSVAIIDAEAEFWTPEDAIKEIVKYDPLLIGLSAFTTKMTAAGKILSLIREEMPGVKTMIGGHHASAVPEQTLREEAVDFAIQGEGYYPTIELLAALKKGHSEFKIPGVWYWSGDRIVSNGHAKGIHKLDDLPRAAWDLLPMEKYRAHHWQAWDYGLDQSRFSLIYTSLGCPFSCEYCSVNVVYGKHSTRFRDPKAVAADLKYLVDNYGTQHFEIIDDTFTVNHRRVEGICDEIINAGLGDKLNMWCFSRTDRVEPKFLQKMKRAGINWVFMGLESGNDTVLLGVNKKQTVGQIKAACAEVHKAGIHIGGNFVFGLPEDSMASMQQTIDLAQELNTEYVNFFVMMAYPGTNFHEMAKEKGYPLPEKWGQYGFFAPDSLPLRNDRLTAEQILEFRDNAFEKYYSSRRYQDMVARVFGPSVVEFLNSRVLSKKIQRSRLINRSEEAAPIDMPIAANQSS